MYSQSNAWEQGKGNGFWAFFRTYILKRGFLDGQQGFMLAISNAEGSYYRHVKLMYLQR